MFILLIFQPAIINGCYWQDMSLPSQERKNVSFTGTYFFF